MYGMQKRIGTPRLRLLTALLAAWALAPNAFAANLTLNAAEQLALAADPGVQSVEANRKALEEMSVASGQLPDPLLKMGLVSLPTDTFHLGQEPMTQVQVGLVQKFPRGQTRSLRAQQIGLKSEGLDAVARDQELQVTLAVREQYLEVLKQQRLARINNEAVRALADLLEITEDYYATGRVQQQDVQQAAVE